MEQQETYDKDFDILHLHSRMASILRKDKTLLPFIDEDIEQEQDSAKKASLLREREILATLGRWKMFCCEVKDVLWDYFKLHCSDEGCDDPRLILPLVNKYVTIAKKYSPSLPVMWTPLPIFACARCGRETSEDRCGRCDAPVEKDLHLNKPKRSTAGSVSNFMRFITSLECNTSIVLPQALVGDLDNFATQQGMYTSEEIRVMPLDEYGHRGPYSMNDLLAMLEATDYTAYYSEKRLVARAYWGWEPYSFSSELRSAFQRVCSRVQMLECELNGDSSGSINREWLAAHIILAYRKDIKMKIDVRDFDILRTPEILQQYEDFWWYCCDAIGLQYDPLYALWDESILSSMSA